jgi:hypothetical protein
MWPERQPKKKLSARIACCSSGFSVRPDSPQRPFVSAREGGFRRPDKNANDRVVKDDVAAQKNLIGMARERLEQCSTSTARRARP